MISAMNSGLTGIAGSLKQLSASAHNIANLSTEGFKKNTVIENEGGSEGFVVHIDKSDFAGVRLFESDRFPTEGSNVDFAEETVNQLIAAFEFRANVMTFKTADDARKSIIDLVA